jgi:NADPH-dependent 2,4-dienoyl-CoA reductase/sulfur reductase-like enzyme/rhodanese-related sulfurtransferase
MAKQVIFIGGVALGSKAACRFKRLEPDSKAVIIDADNLVSYGGCGIPYYISGDVSDISELRTTSFHMIRDEKFFKNCKDVDLWTETRVTNINRAERSIDYQTLDGRKDTMHYDKLVIGTGSKIRPLSLPGLDLSNVHAVGSLHDAITIKEKVIKGKVEKAVVIGAGFIGLEMAEALADMWEIDTTVIELFDQIMPGFIGPVFARMAQSHMEEKGVHFHIGEKVTALEGDENGVRRVVTDRSTIDADLVITAVGVVPEVALAEKAGLEIGRYGIVVNEKLETSDPDIYSGGDCAQITNLVTGKPAFIPLGSMANRQGRVIGTNLAGGDASFPGGVGTFAVKVFENALAGSGLTLQNALKEGFDAASIQISQLDRAHFYPTRELMFLELVVDRASRRVLGIQGFGGNGDALVGRIDAVAALLSKKATVDEISNLELAYSPPFSSALDILNALGNAAENLIENRFNGIVPDKFEKVWKTRENKEYFFLDCRAVQDGQPYVEKYPDVWVNIPQDELRSRIDEVPRDKKIILVCNTGVRSYEAQLNLRELGFENETFSIEGGVAAVDKIGIDI